MDEMKLVKFSTGYSPYQAGETAGFSPKKAKMLCSPRPHGLGVASYVTKDAAAPAEPEARPERPKDAPKEDTRRRGRRRGR